jgi:PAS domain S-box-containing protein
VDITAKFFSVESSFGNGHLLGVLRSTASVTLAIVSLTVFIAVLLVNSTGQASPILFLSAIAVFLLFAVFFHARLLSKLQSTQRTMIFDLQKTQESAQRAQKQLAANRAFLRSASTETEALRKNALSLIQEVQLDTVLDALLTSLRELVPYESAQVLLREDKSRLLLAREISFSQSDGRNPIDPITLDLGDFPLLQRIIQSNESALLDRVTQYAGWRPFGSMQDVSSWIAIPLSIANQSLGVLTAGHSEPAKFSPSHLRAACSIAISASAAVQHVRLCERAEIFGSELAKRLSELRGTQKALEAAENQSFFSEETFQKLFRSGPIAFSITTMPEERFLDVSEAFEHHSGYSRSELLGRTVKELSLWQDSPARAIIFAQLDEGRPIRNVVTWLRTKSGAVRPIAYSADRIEIDGEDCLVAVCGDLAPESPPRVN